MTATPAQPASPYSLAVPATWPHRDGPLHGLLDFQSGKCGVCSAPVAWSTGSGDGVAMNSLRQWVEDGLLLGLVCYGCARRYKTMKGEPDGAAKAGLPRFLANPPGQQFKGTAQLGRQRRPRRFASGLGPTEVPSPGTWSYTNTVTHSLFLWQRGRCAICSTGLPVETRPRAVHVDHDESTGLMRGLLCHRCNTCLGQAWPGSWWEHHAPTVQAYLEFPPAQIFPATRGLTMAERTRPAVISWSADRQEMLLDGMPMGIAAAPAADVSDMRWYAVQYDETAPVGLPPVLEASHRVSYSDQDGDWVMFLMNPPVGASSRQARCILRVQVSDVVDITEHSSLQSALNALSD